MLLRNDDFVALKKALLAAFSTQAALEPVIQVATNKSLEQVAIGTNVEEIIERVIRRAADEAWLSRLLGAALLERQNDVELTRLRDEWQAGTRFRGVAAESVDHFKALILPGRLVLLDRQPLRDALVGLEAGTVRVLIVDGDPESGKTYSLQYISYLSEALGTFSFAPVDLEQIPKNAANKVDAPGLAEAIASALFSHSGPQRAADHNHITWLGKYFAWLASQLSPGEIRWLVIDSFRKVTAEQNAYDLIADLAMRTYRELPMLRLVLLSYGDHEWLKARVVGAVEYERIEQISNEHLVRFFLALLTDQSERRGDPIDQQVLTSKVIASVKRVIEGTTANRARRLEALARATWNEVDTILNQSGAGPDPEDALVAEINRLMNAAGAPSVPGGGP